MEELMQALLESKEKEEQNKKLGESFGIDDQFLQNYNEACELNDQNRYHNALFRSLLNELTEQTLKIGQRIDSLIRCAPPSLRVYQAQIYWAKIQNWADQDKETLEEVRAEESKATADEKGKTT